MSSTTRAGRRTQPRQSAPAPRTLACRTCAKRRVRCDGMSPCEACLRHAAWKGRPAPTECEFDVGVVPTPNPAVQPSLSADAYAAASGAGHHGSGSADASSPEQETAEVFPSFGKNPGKPLQKGLACISCKARRVKCDGAKPACSSCVKSAKWKHEAVQCVYRADLYVQRCREEEMRRMGTNGVKPDDTDDGCCPPEPAVDPSSSSGSSDTMPPGEMQARQLTYIGVPTVLPAILPPLPPLPPLPVLHTLANRTKEDTPMCLDEPTLASSSSSSTSFHVGRSDSTTFFAPPRASRASSQSGLTTNPPSPAITHSETDLSSWPSPRSPLDEWCSNLVTTYPPVPYPPATSFEGINPAWMEALNAGMIPPLSLETLGLGPGGASNDFDMTGLSMPPPSAGNVLKATAALRSEAGFGTETLALPMETPWASSADATLPYE
ncbi:hypothetical protein JCM10908_004977 [Rhodotorula pacifica]|uniref:Zn(II)2Cys6 transcription factor domain-containing protein n=1 Tax=Rhodotorula pacifica TaxID=1495444 RepID=UPI00317A157C